MNIEAKPRTLVAVLVMIVVVVGGYFYIKKTAPIRTYKTEIKRLRMISEHQGLEIEVANQRATLNAMRKVAEDAVPRMRLVPEDPNQ